MLGQNGWARHLHFLSAWVCVVNGLAYVLSGLLTRHFRLSVVPAGRDLSWVSLSRAVADHLRLAHLGDNASSTYNVLQRLAYSGVVFLLLPLAIWTGLAMSPAIASVFLCLQRSSAANSRRAPSTSSCRSCWSSSLSAMSAWWSSPDSGLARQR